MTALATQPEARPAPDVADIVIKCAQLSKNFKDFWMRSRVRAVEGIDFEVYRGEVFGLLGPNGSGKSTTIKMILGLLHPTAGRIAVFGKPATDVTIKERIGYLPEESYLYRFLNARETLDYYGRLFHQDRRLRQRRIDMLLEMVGLDKVQRRPIGEYSKGMQRRIGLAQALINDPELLILDEPTTGLDPIGTKQVKDLILDLARPRKGKPGKTVLLCSHLLADVEDVCHRVAIMFGGKIRKYGTVESLLVQEGRTTIETDALPPEVVQQIEELLAKHGRHIEKVEQPRQKLEALFLDIVNKALAEGVATTGATSGGRTAGFLVEEADGQPQGDAVIDRLVSQGEPQRPAPEPARPVAPPPERKVVEALQQPATPPPPARPAPSPQPEPAANREVIDDLLGGDRPAKPAAPAPKPSPHVAPPAPGGPTRNPLEKAAQAPAKEEKRDEKPDRSFLDALINTDPKEGEPRK